jgi:hypothetical protein
LGTSEIDMVPLNDAPPLLKQRALRDGVRLVERDSDERVRLETRAVLEFFDTQPLRDARRERLRKMFKEDRFGRRESARVAKMPISRIPTSGR